MTKLSAPSTIFWKFGFTGVWVVGGISVIVDFIRAGLEGHTNVSLSTFLGPLLFLSFGAAFSYWMLGSLKKISIDGGELVVSNYLKSIRTPFSHVAVVHNPDMTSHQRIRITFSKPTEFGSNIVFMPRIFEARATAEILRRAIDRADKDALYSK